MNRSPSTGRRLGMTAIEVLASTILSALLMTALIGVLRGLKAHETTLQLRRPEPAWQASLSAALAADLEHAVTYELTPQALTLRGHGNRNESGQSTWLPATIVYELRPSESAAWLVRREVLAVEGGGVRPDNVVLGGVTEVRAAVTLPKEKPSTIASMEGATTAATPIAAVKATPLPDDLAIEFWGTSRLEPVFSYRHRRL